MDARNFQSVINFCPKLISFFFFLTQLTDTPFKLVKMNRWIKICFRLRCSSVVYKNLDQRTLNCNWISLLADRFILSSYS